jgi:uncharacterized protein (DUF924 family)
MDTPSPADVLRVWFGTDDPQGIVAPQMDRWFKTDPDFDTGLRERFGAAIAAGIRGELAPWEDTPGGALALVILLDQFSRNAWRGDARSFAADPAALAAAERAVSRGFDRDVAWLARSFLYLPWEHAESLAHQDRAVALFRALAAEAPRRLRGPGRFLRGVRREAPGRHRALRPFSAPQRRPGPREHRRRARLPHHRPRILTPYRTSVRPARRRPP